MTNLPEQTQDKFTSYNEWLELYKCSHGHCPYECEHPQPFIDLDGRLVCGKCWWDDGDLSVMIPCTPENCD